jgi:hypothetical protein
MALVSALILTRFRETAEKAAAWLTKERYQALFLDLPEDFMTFVREYMAKGTLEDYLSHANPKELSVLLRIEEPDTFKIGEDPLSQRILEEQR